MGCEAWGEGENTISPLGLQCILIIPCSSEVRGVTGPCQDNRGTWECFLIIPSPKAVCCSAHCAQIHLCDCPGAVPEDVAEELDWVSLSSGQKKSHPFTVGSLVTSHHTSWLQLLWKETSLPLVGDLLHCQDLSQSHHQSTLADLLLVMTHCILQLHSLGPTLPPKNPKPPHVLHGVYPLNASSPVKSTACRQDLPGIKKMEDAFQEK